METATNDNNYTVLVESSKRERDFGIIFWLTGTSVQN